MYWNHTYVSKMWLSTIWDYYFGIMPTFTQNLDQKWVKYSRFRTFDHWEPVDVECNCASFELSFEAAQGCLILVMAEKRTKIRFYSRIFKNIRKNSWYFWCLGWDLSSCGVEIMIVGHSRDLKKFTEFNLIMHNLCINYA